MSDYRVQFVYDTDAEFEEVNGTSEPLSAEEYAQSEYQKDGKPVSYVDYLAYYGNPDRHVYFGCVVERKCDCCGGWSVAESVWRIDVMDDDPSLAGLFTDHWYTPDEARALPDYFGDTARELLSEAAANEPEPKQ